MKSQTTSKSKLAELRKIIREHVRKVILKEQGSLYQENNQEDIIDYYKSRNIISVGMKTNLLSNMKSRYDFKVNGDEIYFFDKGFHFATLFKEGSFYELKHDGTLDQYGWRKP